MKKILLFLSSIILVFSLSSCALWLLTDNSEESTNTTQEDYKSPTDREDANKELTFDTPFVFDDLEITIGSEMSWTTVDNQFSEFYKQDVIKIPVTIKNLDDETNSLNVFFYKYFAPDGTEITDKLSTYFDDDVFYSGDLRSGATINTFFHILYKGDGNYYIEFEIFEDPISVKLPIKK